MVFKWDSDSDTDISIAVLRMGAMRDSVRRYNMKKLVILLFLTAVSVVFLSPLAGAQYTGGIVEKIRLSSGDIPQGFAYGNIPPFAKKILKENPWSMDKSAIRALTSRIYPGGESARVSAIHVTILARNYTPYGDDIVCYIIVFNDSSEAKAELKKLTDFAGFNSDRVIVLSRENMAVFLHVDDADDFPLIRDMAGKLEERLNKS